MLRCHPRASSHHQHPYTTSASTTTPSRRRRLQALSVSATRSWAVVAKHIPKLYNGKHRPLWSPSHIRSLHLIRNLVTWACFFSHSILVRHTYNLRHTKSPSSSSFFSSSSLNCIFVSWSSCGFDLTFGNGEPGGKGKGEYIRRTCL